MGKSMSNKKTLVWGMLALWLAVLLAGCDGSEFVDGPVRSVPRQFGGLEFTLSAPKSRYARGENVPLTLSVKNLGTQTLTAHFGRPVAQVLQVKQGSQVIWEFPQGTAGVGMTLQFAPGETKTFTENWDQFRNQPGPTVPSGIYSVEAWLNSLQIGSTLYTQEEAQAQLKANPISVTIQ
jgi:hypothetical protein